MKKFLGFIGALSAQLSLATPVFAQQGKIELCNPQDPAFGKLCQFGVSQVGQIIGTLITIALLVAVVIALFFLIYGGIRWILSGGDKTAIETARNTIVAAIVGLAVALLAFFILNILARIFGIDLTKLEIPSLVK